MEQTITGIEILPREEAYVTPMELIEDFADHAQAWHFLDVESHHYAEERGRPSSILRYHRSTKPHEVNFVFVAASDEKGAACHLRLVAGADGGPALTSRQRQRVLQDFVEAFSNYLDGRNEPLRMSVSHTDDRTPVATA